MYCMYCSYACTAVMTTREFSPQAAVEVSDTALHFIHQQTSARTSRAKLNIYIYQLASAENKILKGMEEKKMADPPVPPCHACDACRHQMGVLRGILVRMKRRASPDDEDTLVDVENALYLLDHFHFGADLPQPRSPPSSPDTPATVGRGMEWALAVIARAQGGPPVERRGRMVPSPGWVPPSAPSEQARQHRRRTRGPESIDPLWTTAQSSHDLSSAEAKRPPRDKDTKEGQFQDA